MSRAHRGLGRVFIPSYKDKAGKRVLCSTWTLEFGVNGKQYREYGFATEAAAKIRLKQRLGEMGLGTFVGTQPEKTTIDQLLDGYLADYTINKRKSLDRAQDAVAHLRVAFTGWKANAITSDKITTYIKARQTAKAANATINRELAALKRAFRLALRAGLVGKVPYIGLLREDNARQGFFEIEQFESVRRHLPDPLKALVTVMYLTGWRKQEVLSRQWKHLDLEHGWLRLEPGETKNKDGRQFPLLPQLRQVLEAQRTLTDQLQKEAGTIIPWIFHRDGTPVRYFRRAWLSACKAAGCPGRIPHDFRRTACRNLERSGVPRSVAMKLVGHKTESVYRRYAIASEGDLRDAGLKLAALHEAQAAKMGKVTQLRAR